ncbi:hypothetical protein ACYSNU_07085 [Enterococcus sp. LJL120]
MKKYLGVTLGITLLMSLGGCSNPSESSSGSSVANSSSSSSLPTTEESTADSSMLGEPEIYETDFGTFEVAIPAGWKNVDPSEFSGDADIAFENAVEYAYLNILSENKEDFASFTAYKELVYPSLVEGSENLTEEEVSYNNFSGTRYRFDYQTEDGLNTSFITDILDGNEYYIQSISWTSKSGISENQAEMVAIMESLTEIPASE